MKHFVRAVTAMLAVCLLSGCATRLGDLSVASTHLVSQDAVNLDTAPTQRHVTGTSQKWIVLFIPLGIPHIGDAVDDALIKGGGDLLTNATIHATGWWFLIGKTGYEVTGDVVRTRDQSQSID